MWWAGRRKIADTGPDQGGGGVMARDMTADVLREVLRMRGCKAPMSAINTAAELIALGEWSRGSRPWFDALERAADRLMLQYGADRLPGYLWAQYVAGRVAP